MKIQNLDVKKRILGNKDQKSNWFFVSFLFFLFVFFFCGFLISRILIKKGVMSANFSIEEESDKVTDSSQTDFSYEMWRDAGLPVLKLYSVDGAQTLSLDKLNQEGTLIAISTDGMGLIHAQIVSRFDEVNDTPYFQINLLEDQTVFGMQNFYLFPSPELTYGNLAFIRNAKNEGLLTTDLAYIYLDSNDDFKGIFLAKEIFPVPKIVNKSSEDRVFLWINLSETYGNQNVSASPDQKKLDYSFIEDADNPDSVMEYSHISSLLDDYQKTILPLESVFDVAKLGKYYALMDLWNMTGERGYFYFNPETSLLEPVYSDINISFDSVNINSRMNDYVSDWIFGETLVREYYAKELFKMTKEDYFNLLTYDFQDEEVVYEELFASYDASVNGKSHINYYENLEIRTKVLSLEFSPYQTIHGTYTFSETNSQLLEVDLANLLLFPVEITGLEINDFFLPIDSDRISISESSSLSGDFSGVVLEPLIHPEDFAPEPLHLSVEIGELENLQTEEAVPLVRVMTKIAGINTEFSNSLVNGQYPELVSSNPLPIQPSLSEVLKAHPFLDYSEEDQILVVFPGEWEVNGDLILPDGIGIKILAGTTLRFGEDKILFSNAPIQIKGNSDEPIYLTAQNENWGGIAVIQAGEPSAWKYVTLDKIRGSNEYGDMLGIVRGAWVLTSGINFYYSPLQLDHARILNMNTEDAINLIHSEFVFDSSEFAYSYADAFDSDFSNGEIKNCRFHDIGGDAIDASGSEIMVKEVLIQNIQDKGISAGEESTITVQGADLEKIAIGVASKDLSEVILEDVTINGASTAALAAYIKKNVFGPARITATNLHISNSPTEVIVQTGCEISVDGEKYQTVELDVKELYERGILGN